MLLQQMAMADGVPVDILLPMALPHSLSLMDLFEGFQEL
jgi:hypothetical protein